MDYAAISSALYARAASDSAGATLRGLLGSNAGMTAIAGQTACIFRWSLLGRVKALAPATPWLVWRALGTSGQSGEERGVSASFFAYVSPAAGDTPLLTIASAIEALYGIDARYAIPGGKTSVTFIGQPFPDEILGLNGIETRIVYTQRG